VKSPLAARSLKRESWGETVWGAAILWVILIALWVPAEAVTLAKARGFGNLWLLTALGLVIMTSITLAVSLLERYEMTQEEVLAEIGKRRANRGGQPRDIVALAAASAEDRGGWYRLVRRRSRRAAVLRLLVSVVLIAIFVIDYWRPAYQASHSVGYVLFGLTGFLGVAFTLFLVHLQGGDPLLLVGEFEHAGHSYGNDAARAVMIFGRTRTLTVMVRAACVLRADGGLETRADLRGSKTIGARRKVVRRLIEGEHCVLLCSGAEDAVFQVGALIASEDADVGKRNGNAIGEA
jgi:hypothetical protein